LDYLPLGISPGQPTCGLVRVWCWTGSSCRYLSHLQGMCYLRLNHDCISLGLAAATDFFWKRKSLKLIIKYILITVAKFSQFRSIFNTFWQPIEISKIGRFIGIGLRTQIPTSQESFHIFLEEVCLLATEVGAAGTVPDGIDKQHSLQGDLGGAAVVTETLAAPATMVLQNKATISTIFQTYSSLY